MRLAILKPYSSTGFLLRDALGAGRDILIDMQGAGGSLEASLRMQGSGMENIRHLLITHFHSDHLTLAEAADLADAGAKIHIGRQTWREFSDWLSNADRPPEERSLYERIGRSGSLERLDSHGAMTIGEREVVWATYKHGNGDYDCDNLAFRVDERLFTGDTSVRHLFDPEVSGSEELLGLRSGDKVRVLCMNIAQIDRKEINANPDLDPRRRRNYLENHGILEDVLEAISDESLAAFWSGIRVVVPHHIRRQPLPETASLMADLLTAAARSRGLKFQVRYAGPDG